MPPGNAKPCIRLHYNTRWPDAFVHYRIENDDWTLPPGLKMSPSPLVNGWKYFSVDAQSLEFVLTDSRSWDNNGGRNYRVDVPGTYTLSGGELIRVKDDPPFLLVTDLDGTLISTDDRPLLNFNHKWCQHFAPRGCLLVYTTGRSLTSFQGLAQSKPLLQPRTLICAVGTQIYTLNHESGSYVLDSEWTDRLAEGWNRDAVCRIAAQHRELALQPSSEQNPLKVSFVCPTESVTRIRNALQEDADEQGLQVQFVWSGSGPGRYLDCLPAGAGKYTSLQYVRGLLGFPPDRTIVCGDSGNDIGLFMGDECGIVVGNAQGDLIEYVRSRNKPNHMLTAAHVAEGILQGIQRLGFW